MIKLGEASLLSDYDVKESESVLSDSVIAGRMSEESEMLVAFKKQAETMKQIAPRAKDFLYFTAIFMHAAEASLLDAEGNVKLGKNGKELQSEWIAKGDSIKWKCSDPSVMPYRNSNLDIFREAELKKAHKLWVGKPLCLDHKSNEIEKVRGLIVDTYYDEKHKRVVGLCALDKVNYPELARQVETLTTTSVSMGTGVGRAICMTCGNVARTERDFCDHMKARSCYGEINEDLNPIELSIVVNGADPKARIKHIVAAADKMAQYIEAKEAEVNGLNDPIEVLAQINRIVREAEEMKVQIKSEAAEERAIMKTALDEISNKMTDIVQRLDKKEHEGSDMTTKNAYWQGTEEPTPGAVKYEKQDSDSTRNTKDKQMIVEPSGGMGATDKLFPGDEEKKRALQRAALLQRAKDSLDKRGSDKVGYFQGGGGANEPEIGKVKYAPDASGEKTRKDEDKQMKGESPFPGVGKVDGLYGDDEAKKKLLQRASLKAKLVKAANPSESVWQVFAADKLVLSATVGEITRGNVMLNDQVTTKAFGTEMLKNIQVKGFDATRQLLKGAQMPAMQPPPPSMAPNMSMPGDTGGAAPMGSDPSMGGASAKDNDMGGDGGNGDPKEECKNLIDELGKLTANLAKSFEAMTNEPSNELDAVKPDDMSADLKAMTSARREFKSNTLDTLREMMTEAKEELVELRSTAELLSPEVRKVASADRRELIDEVASQSLAEARRVISDCYAALGSVTKYAKGTKSMLKRAQLDMLSQQPKDDGRANVIPMGNMLTNDERSKALQQGGVSTPEELNQGQTPAKPVQPGTPTLDKTLQHNTDLANAKDCDMDDDSLLTPEELAKAKAHKLPAGGSKSLSDAMKDSTKNQDTSNKKPSDTSGDKKMNVDFANDGKDKNDATMTTPTGTKVDLSKDEVKDVMKSANFNLNTREGRTAYRAKIAEKTMQYNKVLNEAHPGGGTTTKLDNKPSLADGAKIESKEEIQKIMLEVANAPPKVKAMAAKIEATIKAGKMKASELDGMVALGLDAQAVSYWKKFYGQEGSEGKEFANQLTSEHAAKKAAAEKAVATIKLARSLELAAEMASKGMCSNSPAEIAKQAHAITEYTDSQFESVKSLVNHTPMQKQAQHFPQVGMMGSPEFLPAAPQAKGNIQAELDDVFSGSAGRRSR